MYGPGRLSAAALILTACAGAPRVTAPSEPLVIPPMGGTPAGTAVVTPPPSPPPPHFATPEECATIMRKIVDLTLEHSSLDQAQRNEILKSLTQNAAGSGPSSMCSKIKVDDEIMGCVGAATEVDAAQKCLAPANQPSAGGDDDDEP